MIKTLNKGGAGALIIGIVLVMLTKYVTFSSGILAHGSNWVLFSVFCVLIVLQGIWFQRVIHNARFFEHTSIVPFLTFLMVNISLPTQVNHFIPLLVNFVFLIFYQKLFYPKDRDQVDRQIFLEAGLLTGILIILDPKLVLIVPFVLLLLNQFIASSVNRTLLVFLTAIMVLTSYLSILYFSSGFERIQSFVSRIEYHIDYATLLDPANLYTYVIYLVAIVLIAVPVYRQLAFMQNMKRYIINMLYLQILFLIIVAILAGDSFPLTLNYLSLPIAFILAFGIQHIKFRWMQNVVVLIFLFALVFTQIVYQLP